jgi:hypothetical protein
MVDDFAVLLFDSNAETLELSYNMFKPLLTIALRDDETHKVRLASCDVR